MSYGDVATAGSYGDVYTSDGGAVTTAVTVAFNAIPEPSTALLGAIGFLALLRRRR